MKNGQWKRVPTYGGKLCENATQATSRELLENAKAAVIKYGYHPILTVYDEIVCEENKSFGSAKELATIMSECVMNEPWAAGWPVSVDPWQGDRYKK